MATLHAFTVMLAIDGEPSADTIRQIEKNISAALNNWKANEGFSDDENVCVEEVYEVDHTASYPNDDASADVEEWAREFDNMPKEQ